MQHPLSNRSPPDSWSDRTVPGVLGDLGQPPRATSVVSARRPRRRPRRRRVSAALRPRPSPHRRNRPTRVRAERTLGRRRPVEPAPSDDGRPARRHRGGADAPRRRPVASARSLVGFDPGTRVRARASRPCHGDRQSCRHDGCPLGDRLDHRRHRAGVPRGHARLRAPLRDDERTIEGYARLLTDDSPAVRRRAGDDWDAWEVAHVSLGPLAKPGPCTPSRGTA